ncbi:MAG: CBS domain-containing protein [Epulopiscium sp.]|nr:CBS domain-containing protein [Candidatus Epulonipiscium sp.]
MKVRDIMTQNIFSVDEEESVLKASQIMRDTNVGSVPVRDGEEIVGIITDRDIVIRNAAEGQDVRDTICREIMSKDVITCSPDMDINEAVDLMAQNQIRRIPVIEDNKIVGMVSLGDLATKQTMQSEAGEALKDISTPSMPDYQ